MSSTTPALLRGRRDKYKLLPLSNVFVVCMYCMPYNTYVHVLEVYHTLVLYLVMDYDLIDVVLADTLLTFHCFHESTPL